MTLKDNSKKKITYPNAVVRRFDNKSVAVVKNADGTYSFEVVNLDKEFAHLPAVEHKVFKGKVRVNHFRMSKETFEAIIISSIEILQSNPTHP